MKIILLLVVLTTIGYSQTVSFTPTYHFGNYSEGNTIVGDMEPTFDWTISLYVPLTEKIAVTPSVYYYFAMYKDRIFEERQPPLPLSNIKFYETFWYISISFEYTFSDEPLFK